MGNPLLNSAIGKISFTSPIVINAATRAPLAVETKSLLFMWLANLNNKSNVCKQTFLTSLKEEEEEDEETRFAEPLTEPGKMFAMSLSYVIFSF